MTDSIKFGPTEVVDLPNIQIEAFKWAKKHEVLLPEIASDYEYSVIINGLRILEEVLVRQMKNSKNNKSLYLFPLKAADKIDHLEESLKD